MALHKRKNKLGIILIFFSSILIFISCYKDNEQELYGFVSYYNGSSCDTTNITFSGKINPIIQQNCIGCHGSFYTSMGGGINLQTAATVATIAKDNNRLYKAVTTFADVMPKGGSKLSDCQILWINLWVTKGAPNN